eukprot:CAMPEP_0119128246 /NCGR_PEP_ID=MMETSP1310-20130426/6477_1 /TAXON_ID=464262 /ORGANISM="Genus nov. species nov., Strain RCC2339" /LENGTH=553 /DNA_ID=CAMNT_0007118567 /DNA_START=45 /DNA_END=1702 /DNA_ORIENTATION=-
MPAPAALEADPADVPPKDLPPDPVRRHQELVPQGELAVGLEPLPDEPGRDALEEPDPGDVHHRRVAADVRQGPFVAIHELGHVVGRELGRVPPGAVEHPGHVLPLLLGHLGGRGQGPQLAVHVRQQLLEVAEADGAAALELAELVPGAVGQLLEVGELLGAAVEGGDQLLLPDAVLPPQAAEQALRVLQGVGPFNGGAVPEGVDGALRPFDAQALVHREGPHVLLRARRQALHDLLAQRVHLHPRAPHAHAEGHAALHARGLVGDGDDPVPHALHRAVEHQRDVGAAEVLGGVLGEAAVIRAQHRVHEVHDLDVHVLHQLRGVQPGHVLLHHVVHLGRQLHARGARPHHQEGEELAHTLGGRAGDDGALEALDDALAHAGGVGRLLEEQAVLLHPGDAERVGHRPHPHHQVVVRQPEGLPRAGGALAPGLLGLGRDVGRPAQDRPGARVHRDARRLQVGEAFVGEGPPDALDDGALLHTAHGRPGQQRGVQEVVAGAHQHHLVQLGLQGLDEAHRRPPRPQHHHALLARALGQQRHALQALLAPPRLALLRRG